jgi:EAL domain-containing protein (putative c-di-GMP-specific phosphodiesterase class I)
MESSRTGRVLLVDDDEVLRRALRRALSMAGHEVLDAASVREALAHFDVEPPDVVVSDLHMPGGSGLELLQAVSRAMLDVPVIFLTGGPSIETAAKAIRYGAFRYLVKPVGMRELQSVVAQALEARWVAKTRDALGSRADLERSFHRALRSLWIAAQPIVTARSRRTLGFELLLRSEDVSLSTPSLVLDAAERLGAVHVLGRAVRAHAASAIAGGPPEATYFVNLHPFDLADVDLFDPQSPLARHASRVVLEVTERAALEHIADASKQLDLLRALDYRIAIDDLGAGYAGLSYFASVRPDVVKLDMSLVRDIDVDRVKQEVVLSLVTLGNDLGIEFVAEGVESRGEREMVVGLGCTHLQGFAFARPDRGFPEPIWEP